jgi:dCTP deaminase
MTARPSSASPTDGILPSQTIATMIRDGQIRSSQPVQEAQIQPASLDLRLGRRAYRVRASFLPGQEASVLDTVAALDAYEIDISAGAVLERGCVYVVPLQESLALHPEISALTNPKSSIGRLDVLTRLITDGAVAFDRVTDGYHGPLYAEIVPRTFSIVVRPGSRLNQIRFRRGVAQLPAIELAQHHAAGHLLDGANHAAALRDNLLGVTIDLEGGSTDSLVGWRARRHTDRIDLDRVDHYEPLAFWEPIHRSSNSTFILDPDAFYILATREKVRIPPHLTAEMIAYDTQVGEFRVHYAGFFDPGFGCDTLSGGSRAVLEVRSHEVPFVLKHGQTIGWLRYERMAGAPDRLYGPRIGSSYQSQGLALAKQFRATSSSPK